MFYKLICSLLVKFSKVIKYTLCFIRSFVVSKLLKSKGIVKFGRIGKLKNPQYIEIGKGVEFDDDIYLTAWCFNNNIPELKINDNCSFGAYNHISCLNNITIGENFLSGKFVTITDNSHGTTYLEDLQIPPRKRSVLSKGKIVIEANVWVGDKVTILPNVRIGTGAVVAANSVVNKSVPPYCVVGGIPAKILKYNI